MWKLPEADRMEIGNHHPFYPIFSKWINRPACDNKPSHCPLCYKAIHYQGSQDLRDDRGNRYPHLMRPQKWRCMRGIHGNGVMPLGFYQLFLFLLLNLQFSGLSAASSVENVSLSGFKLLICACTAKCPASFMEVSVRRRMLRFEFIRNVLKGSKFINIDEELHVCIKIGHFSAFHLIWLTFSCFPSCDWCRIDIGCTSELRRHQSGFLFNNNSLFCKPFITPFIFFF